MSKPSITYAVPAVPAHRRAVLQAMLGIIVGCGALFLVLNWLRGNIGVAVAEFVMMLYAGAILVLLARGADVRSCALAYLVPFFAALLFACWSPASSAAVFIWVLLVPVVSYLLLGRRQGFAITAVCLLAAAAIFAWKYTRGTADYPTVAIVDLVVCAASIFALSHVYEVIRARTEASLGQMAMRDALTGMANRARFEAIFDQQRNQHERNKAPVCLLLVDLDKFKAINDTLGHEAGDVVLRFIAKLFDERLRKTDLACRLGGDEFAIILANTSAAQARDIAERIRTGLAARHCCYRDQHISVSATIGLAQLGADGHDLQTLLGCADRRLYEGKNRGRDRVVIGC